MCRKRERKSGLKKRTQKEVQVKYYLIFTDTKKTEKLYFEGLKNSLPKKEDQEKICIDVYTTDTKNLVSDCVKKIREDSQPRIPWIVFDKDDINNFDEIIEEAKKNSINVGWSNPCIEIWFYAYFNRMPTYISSKKCCSYFENLFKKKTGQDYDKSDEKIYELLTKYGDEKKAVKKACERLKQSQCTCEKPIPSKMNPGTKLYELIKDIKNYET